MAPRLSIVVERLYSIYTRKLHLLEFEMDGQKSLMANQRVGQVESISKFLQLRGNGDVAIWSS